VRFAAGVFAGFAVGVLVAWPDAGPSPRRARAAREAEGLAPSAPARGPDVRAVARAALRPPAPPPSRPSPERPSPGRPTPRPPSRARIERLLATGHYADALRAADLLARAGRDTNGLEWAFREVVVRIDRHRGGEPGGEAIEALKAVCRNRFAWRREALEAARALSLRARHEVRVRARDTVEHLRARVVPRVDLE